MTFTTGLLMKDSQEHVLTKTDGTGSGTIAIQESEGKLSVDSKKPVTVKQVLTVADSQRAQYAVDHTAENMTLSQDGTLSTKGDSASLWMILVLVCCACGGGAVLLLVLSSRKRVS